MALYVSLLVLGQSLAHCSRTARAHYSALWTLGAFVNEHADLGVPAHRGCRE
jgi:hypothetical protein